MVMLPPPAPPSPPELPDPLELDVLVVKPVVPVLAPLELLPFELPHAATAAAVVSANASTGPQR